MKDFLVNLKQVLKIKSICLYILFESCFKVNNLAKRMHIFQGFFHIRNKHESLKVCFSFDLLLGI